MGSDAHLLVATRDEHLVGAAIEELERLEHAWSRFRSDSELVALNQDPGEVVTVSPLLAEAVHRAVLAWERTDGWFDPTVIDSLEHAGYDAPFAPDGPPRGSLASCRPAATPRSFSVDLERCTVRRPAGVRLDLGGIGKGLAADRIATGLVDRGAQSACVSMGGDVRVAGIPPEGGWRIPVERPDRVGKGAAMPIWFDAVLDQGAVVTSTTRRRRWRTGDGGTAHHLIDPRTGHPSPPGVTSVVVCAAEAWWGEVLAKAALLAGPEEGRRLLSRHDATGWFDLDGTLEGAGAAV